MSASDNNQTVTEAQRGTTAQPQAGAVQAGDHVGKYEILHELGRGNCGVVYLAHDPFVDRKVAIKLANPAPGASAPSVAENEFLAEARSAGRLQHPNIVGVYDAGVHQGQHFLVMEYVDGRTLGQIPGDELSPSRVVEIAYDCARALGYAHRTNVLHRDIKPDNVIVRNDGTAKVMDFSIAAVMQNQKFRPGVVLGTPKYMAPEQIAGVTMGPLSDLYSLGAVMYYMLAGRAPHLAKTRPELLRLIQCERAVPLRKRRPDLPPRLDDIVDKLLELDPAKRYASGDELATELLKVWDRRSGVKTQGQLSKPARRLAELPFAALMSPAEVEELMAAGTIRTFSNADVVAGQGRKSAFMSVLIVGEIQLGQRPGLRLSPGQVFGHLGPPQEPLPSIDAVGATPGALLELSFEALEKCSVGCRYRVYQACTFMLQEQLLQRV